MPFVVRCACGKRIKAEDRYAGRRAPCPACRRVIAFPTPDRVDGLAGPAPSRPRRGRPALTRGRTAPADDVPDWLELLEDLGADEVDARPDSPIPRARPGPAAEPAPDLNPAGKKKKRQKKPAASGGGGFAPGFRMSPLVALLLVLLGFTAAGLYFLVMPALAEAEAAGHRARCVNNFKELGRAVEAFGGRNGRFPADITDGAGRPLLSWRVAVLPELGRRDLYEQFRLDEPWDSPHNRALLARMPPVYDCPAHAGPPGLTTCRAYAAPGTLMEPGRAIDFHDVKDGKAATILAVDSEEPVEWTRPEDLPIHAPLQAPVPRGVHQDRFNALFADGAVKSIRRSIDPRLFNALLTREGGEVFQTD